MGGRHEEARRTQNFWMSFHTPTNNDEQSISDRQENLQEENINCVLDNLQ